MLEAAIDQVRGRDPVYPGPACISTRDTVYLSRRGQQLGPTPPASPSFAARQQEELSHYRQVAEKVDIPIILYNIPARTGNRLLPETVARLAREVDLIRGAKDSSGDLDNLRAYIQVTRDMGKDFSVLAGNDGNILACLQAGGAGGVAGRANLWPRTIVSIYHHFVAGELEKAREAQEAILALQRVFRYGNPNTIIKKGVALLGYPVGDCRRPFHDLCDEGMAELRSLFLKFSLMRMAMRLT